MATSKQHTIQLREVFLGLQQQMSAKLTFNQKVLTHPVTKGDAAELEWVDMLNTYLPRRYQVDKAFVIDHKGYVSDQIDIVVFDRQFSPFLLRQNGAIYVPAESVYAVIEVKPRLTLANLKYAAKKAASVRMLARTKSPIVHAGGVFDQPKEPFEILAGIVALEGNLSKDCKKLLAMARQSHRINFGCSLSTGSFAVSQIADKAEISHSDPAHGLVTFVLGLVSSLRSLGSVPAMDVEAYISAIKGNRGRA